MCFNRLLTDYLMQTRGLYAPFESDLRSSSSDVYYHEMPGGQFTNLKFQVISLPPFHTPPSADTERLQALWHMTM